MKSRNTLNLKAIWRHFKKEHFSFWMVFAYLLVEYVRPQEIDPRPEALLSESVFVCLVLAGLLADRQKRWVNDPANFRERGRLLPESARAYLRER